MPRIFVDTERLTYFALSPCGRYVKVGRSANPNNRIHHSGGIREMERKFGIGRVCVNRIYAGGDGLEALCLKFLRPDLVDATSREWFFVGPRLLRLRRHLDRRVKRVASPPCSYCRAHNSPIDNQYRAQAA